MKIGVVGATGKAGSFIVKEALNRGHDVTAIVRDAGKVEEKDVVFLCRLHEMALDCGQYRIARRGLVRQHDDIGAIESIEKDEHLLHQRDVVDRAGEIRPIAVLELDAGRNAT